MAIPWLVALKVIPWGDVIEHAPKVLSAARKLLERQRAQTPATPAVDIIEIPAGEAPSLGELTNRLIAAQQQIHQQAQAQEQLTQTVAELAEQNARLVTAVEALRVRSRLLLWGFVALALALAWMAWA
ncbi:MAG: hypothetical protein A3E51_27620 [Burkholderiales bacterium RIFCSPHIGHO2_12_FULL_67_38]|nr:MAG: hypothetical protein A3I64_03295 [Burkholderiales bacterium RIFCSPLOWO2_02_FULL_67_64]OGB37243.1 MAG: hypothetical protein A3E51_27620 [Burkholderiales bacterium RIFCSPHIGHO2_12_FULL_67_38]OGB76837.1 MAG: hypothetical protein A3G82_14960 [Burkholderiales bacterium RIFCSPLOWO2_12_FULL_67_210]